MFEIVMFFDCGHERRSDIQCIFDVSRGRHLLYFQDAFVIDWNSSEVCGIQICSI